VRQQKRLPARIVVALVSLATAVAGLQFVMAPPAAAADASDFDPGFLISDSAFFNGTSMTASQIDDFIDDRNPGCLIAVCLDNYKENVTAKAKTSRCAAITAAKSQSAGKIIATVGRACGISPKAILVILQKEQSLVTSRTPGSHAFEASMGAGCPDTAPCDGKYAGFYANVYYGASLLKGYTLTSSSHYTRYQAGKTSSILYDTTAGCGTRKVFVRNQATHALYVYTPYTPNAAALKNLYGSGDKCSAYGNRNFWRLFIDWFGVTGAYGETEITEFWNANGGGSGAIGEATGAPVLDKSAGGGYYRTYKNGTIAWTQAKGAFFLAKPFNSFWLSTGISSVGWPIESTVTSTAGVGGLTQRFTKGSLVDPEGVSAFYLGNGFTKAWAAYGGPSGSLGWAHGAKSTVRSGLWSVEFDNGTMYHDGTTYGVIAPSFVDTYRNLGDVDGSLGWPVRDYTPRTAGNGIGWQKFQKGGIFNSEEHGIHAVTGAVYATYSKLGGDSKLGWPTSDPYQDAKSGLWVQDFERASIIFKGTVTAAVSTTFVESALANGVLTGRLGTPTGLAKTSKVSGGGTWQVFTGGILAQPKGGDVSYVYGGLLTAWKAKGLATGKLGWPIGSRYIDPVVGTVDQDFQYGTVFHNHKKWGTVGTNFVELARAKGVTTSKFGWATANVVTVSKNGGGQYQTFTKGTLTWQKSVGAMYSPTVVWRAAVAKGGVASSTIGWPRASAKWDSHKSAWKQSFQFATITCVTGKTCTVKATN